MVWNAEANPFKCAELSPRVWVVGFEGVRIGADSPSDDIMSNDDSDDMGYTKEGVFMEI